MKFAVAKPCWLGGTLVASLKQILYQTNKAICKKTRLSQKLAFLLLHLSFFLCNNVKYMKKTGVNNETLPLHGWILI